MTKIQLKNDIKSNSRRDFIKASSLTSVSLLIGLNSKGSLAIISQHDIEGLEVNPLVKIERNGTVTVISKAFEMGQGVTTGFTTLVAEEMNAKHLVVISARCRCSFFDTHIRLQTTGSVWMPANLQSGTACSFNA